MKKIKKLASLLLALVMVLSMTVTGFAAQEGTLTGGSIMIKDAVPGHTYEAYQIFYLESYDEASGAYTYKANSGWEAWLKEQTAYVEIDAQGYITWKASNDDKAAAEFAKLARAELTEKQADASAVAPDASAGEKYSTVTLSNLKLGYYLVNTTLGALCSLDTTNPNATMEEKNEQPTIEKKVKVGEGAWDESNNAKIGDTVEFKTTIKAKPGAENYVLHDKMTEGLTLNQDSISVVGVVGSGSPVPAEKNKDYTVAFNTEDGCDFEITFDQSYLDGIVVDRSIVVTYSAILNESAKVSGDTPNDSNDNETMLEYGNDSETEWDKTETYTYKFDLVKTKTDKTLLSGAKFELYDAKVNGNKIDLVRESEGVYRIATPDEKNAAGFASAVIEAGKVVIKGLETGKYWLEETEAPAGYNKLSERSEIDINNANLNASMSEDGKSWVSGGAHIENKTGSLLPSTGGIGTTIFYAAGIILMAGAVFFVVRRRRAN